MSRSRLYSGAGDDGYTSVLGRERVPKYDLRPAAYGTVDEVTSWLGLAKMQTQSPRASEIIQQVQHDLYALMADLATLPEAATRPPWLKEERIGWLEQQTDTLAAEVEIPPAFVIPGDSQGGAMLDVARAITRRAERLVARLYHQGELRNNDPLRYLNRLSSLLFVLARLEDRAAGVEQFTLARLG
ncbi:MAG: cob(I)yrinic acid a,c-diamide adenosyltransferase [Anaerolineae bacterium]|nr:cob(I)yrinic acid a,c-diamide adenosyltransferase [Anaerolineae bacterium]MDW8101117.1 cob(I)yrinic acid a,c-diamide adenosyltransferase [Anaerolineae bacterium]